MKMPEWQDICAQAWNDKMAEPTELRLTEESYQELKRHAHRIVIMDPEKWAERLWPDIRQISNLVTGGVVPIVRGAPRDMVIVERRVVTLSDKDDDELAWWRGEFAVRFDPDNLPKVGRKLRCMWRIQRCVGKDEWVTHRNSDVWREPSQRQPSAP